MSGSHYFSQSNGVRSPQRVAVTLRDRSVELFTDVGVFSRDGLDAGTAVLLETVPPPPGSGDLLDLGCGYGPIAMAMAMASPGATVWAVDVNQRALALCRQNSRELGLDNVRPCTPGEVPDDVAFSCIWSNPPIRIGKAALHEMLERWLDRLDSDGVAYLVVQRHLGSDSLHRWLSAQGWSTDRASSKKAFRLLRLTARRRPD